MPSWQRATLAILAVLVMVVAGAVLVVTRTPGDDIPTAGGSSTTSSAVPTTSSTTTTLVTTSTAPPSTTTTTVATTTTRPEPLLVMRSDGVGDVAFGDAAEDVLSVLGALFGEPDDDTGWVDQRQNYGVCLGDEVRFVRWGSFQAFFTDGPSDWAPTGVRHFASYTQAAVFDAQILDMVTADGLSLGSPVGDVRAIYGEGTVYDDGLYGPVFVHDPPGPAQLWGSVSGLAPDDVIESITGSYACGE